MMFERDFGGLTFLFRLSKDGMSWTISTQKNEMEYKTTTDFKPLKPCRPEQISSLFELHTPEVEFVSDYIMLSMDVPILAHTYTFKLSNDLLELKKENTALVEENAKLQQIVSDTIGIRSNGAYAIMRMVMDCKNSNNCVGMGCDRSYRDVSIYFRGSREPVKMNANQYRNKRIIDLLNEAQEEHTMCAYYIQHDGHYVRIYFKYGSSSKTLSFKSICNDKPIGIKDDYNFIPYYFTGYSGGPINRMSYLYTKYE